MTEESVDNVHAMTPLQLQLEDVAREIAWQRVSEKKKVEYREQALRFLTKIDALRSLSEHVGEISKLYR